MIPRFSGYSFWIGFMASRYVSRGRRNSPSPVLSVLGIATGVLALIVILAVMNGFQLGFIESIIEISSYHLRAENFPPEKAGLLEERLRGLPGLVSAVPFREFQSLVRGRRNTQHAVLVRCLPPDVLARDPAMAAKLDIEAGSFDLSGAASILLGAELARSLQLRLGDKLTLLSIPGLFRLPDEQAAPAGDPGEDPAQVKEFTVTGIFRCGFYEYDLGWAFINLEAGRELAGEGLSLGLKLRDRWQDRSALAAIERSFAGGAEGDFGGIVFSAWRDYNRAFFGALRTEKLFMFILVGLIFVVVGLNIFQAQRRAVLERREEIGLLRAVGAADKAVRLVFVCDGLIIGFTGAGAGLILGLLVASHIPFFFSLIEKAVNGIIGLANVLSGSFSGQEDFAVFSPAVFYIKEIPSRIIAREVVLIFLFGFLSALFAAWFASGQVSTMKPAEVLRDE
ncbi:MAG: ABC transporter permease [Treponema sp.]|jgi:lipoprotein-releasing system permease protein|nr:ABC transporter permease [Treponema sp.]